MSRLKATGLYPASAARLAGRRFGFNVEMAGWTFMGRGLRAVRDGFTMVASGILSPLKRREGLRTDRESAKENRPERCGKQRPALTITRKVRAMTPKKLPPLDYLRQCLRCDAEAGKLYWLERPSWMFADERICKSMNTQWVGKEAFACRSSMHGFIGRISNVQYLAHRIIYFMATGFEPEGEIDHINGDPFDNRIENLRPVSHAENARNRARNFGSTSPGHGIRQRYGRFIAHMKVDGRQIQLGSFATVDEAAAARLGAERALGYHPNHGRPSRRDAPRRA